MLRRLRDVELVPSPGFVEWLSTIGSIAVVRDGQLTFLGLDPDGALVLDPGHQRRPTALAATGRGLWLAADRFLWRFEDGLDPGASTHEGHDRVLLPQVGVATGDLAATALAVDGDGWPLLTSSRLSALVRPTADDRLEVAWRPSWISEVAPDARTMLTGVALDGGIPRFATSAATTDEPGAWKAHRRDGGVVVDVASGEIVTRGLSLPHAPHLHDGRLWLLHTGAGEIGTVDVGTGAYEPVLTLPAFLRGAALVGRYLVAGGSARRDDRQWHDLVLGERLATADRRRPVMGLFVVDLVRGELVHQLVLDGTPREIFDLEVLPGVRRARAVDPLGDEAQELVVYDAPVG